MCVKSRRNVSASLTLRYDQVLFVLDPTAMSATLARKYVTVCDYPDGRLEIQHDGVCLPYRTFGARRLQRAPVVENKRIDEVLAITDRILPLPPRRSTITPRRRGQADSILRLEVQPRHL